MLYFFFIEFSSFFLFFFYNKRMAIANKTFQIIIGYFLLYLQTYINVIVHVVEYNMY